MKAKIILFGVLLVLLCDEVQGQAWTVYNSANSGLPDNYVQAIAFDQTGRAWFGMYNGGLGLFDGVNFNFYDTSNSGLPSNAITDIAVDSNNVIWIATYAGLATFDGMNWVVYNTTNSGLQDDHLTRIVIDNSGVKWMGCSCTNGSTGFGLAKFDGLSWTIYTTANSGMPDDIIMDLQLDHTNSLWIATQHGGLVKFDGISWVTYNTSNSGLPNNYVTALSLDSHNDIWIGTYQTGISKYDGTIWTNYNSSNSPLLSYQDQEINIDKGDHLWYFNGSIGLVRFDQFSNTIFNSSNSGLPSNIVNRVEIDDLGNKWIGTTSGLAVFTGDSSSLKLNFPNGGETLQAGTAYNVTWSTFSSSMLKLEYSTNNGSSWAPIVSNIPSSIGSYSWIVPSIPLPLIGTCQLKISDMVDPLGFDYTDRAFSIKDTNWTLYNSFTLAVSGGGYGNRISFENSNKWIATRNGVVLFDGSNYSIYNSSNSGLPSNDVRVVMMDNSGNKWFGMTDTGPGTGGLVKYDGVSWTIFNTGNSGLPYDNVNSIVVDASNLLWIGTSNGLASFDGSNWAVYNTSNSGIPSNAIGPLAIDVDGSIWVSTDVGLSKFDGTLWTNYSTSNSGLPSNSIFSIKVEPNGNKWIGTLLGLTKFDNFTWTVYNQLNSGLPTNEVFSIAIDANGNKWIGTFGGLLKFDGNSWELYNQNNSILPENRIWAVDIDSNGLKWIISNSGANQVLLSFYDNGPPSLFSTSIVSGVIYLDINGNGSEDSGEPGLPNQLIQITPDTSYTLSNTNGIYYFPRSINGVYNVSVAVPSNSQLTSSPTVYSVNVSQQATTYSGNDFGLLAISNVNDLSISLSSSPIRCFHQAQYWIDIHNYGSTIQTADVSLEIPSGSTFISASVAPVIQIGDSIFWTLSNLVPGTDATIIVIINAPGSSQSGSIISARATVNPTAGDVNQQNNLSVLSQTFLCSSDPNDKLVNVGIGSAGDILNSQELEYTIRFQNTGNYPAGEIVIRDTIDSDLEFLSIHLIGASHPVVIEFESPRILKCTFYQINLPDSTSDELHSHGYVRFGVRPLPNLVDGTVITNSANIYFDENPSVRTNTTINTVFATATGTFPVSDSEDMSIFPNPANDYLFVSSGNQKLEVINYRIFDISGRVVKGGTLQDNLIKITDLAPQVYWIQVQVGEKMEYLKFLVIN